MWLDAVKKAIDRQRRLAVIPVTPMSKRIRLPTRSRSQAERAVARTLTTPKKMEAKIALDADSKPALPKILGAK